MTSGLASSLGDFTLTVVAGTKAPKEIAVEITASAMDRRGTRTINEQLTVAAEAWTLDDFYNAEPRTDRL